MSDESSNASESGRSPGADDPRRAAAESDYPQPGHRWQGDYFVESALADSTGAAAWKAVHLPTGRELQLRMLRSADPFHEQAWTLLTSLDCPRLLRALGAKAVGAQRVELFELPPGRTLRTWRAEQPGIDTPLLHSFLQDILEGLDALHGAGLVHLHIDADAIFVDERTTPPRLVVGHLERAARFERGDLLPVSGDPFSIPPEAAGLYRHAGGEGLMAWDWWTVGRVLQKLILGRHICELVLGRPLNRSGLQEREYAESFLLEKAPVPLRPGGVEAMTGLEPRVELLLKGLLTASRDARWGQHEVRAWLAGESPQERYSLGRYERVFRWKGQPHTVREVAELLQKAENWDAAPAQIMGGANPATLAGFVHEVQGLRPLAQKLDETLRILDDPELQDFPRESVEEMVLALALNELAGGHLIWRGRRVDAGVLREALHAEDGSGHLLACVWTLTSVPMIAALEKTDSEAVRVLLDASHHAKRALDRAWKHGWLPQNDIKAIARVWELAFSSPTVWHDAKMELRTLYACSTDEEIDRIFQNDRPGYDEALILAFLAPSAHSRGFITHEEWERRQHEALRTRGRRVSEVLFWKRLGRVLNFGPWCLGHLAWLVIGWTLVGTLIAVGWPGPRFVLFALLPGLLALTMRLGLTVLLRGELARNTSVKNWRFTDGPDRCDREIVTSHDYTSSRLELEEDLRDVNSQIAGLTRLNPPPARIPPPSRLSGVWAFAWLSWTLWLGLVGLCGWRYRVHPPTLKAFTSAWSGTAQAVSPIAPKVVKQPWPYTRPDDVRDVKPAASRPANDADIEAAKRAGRSFTDNYQRSTISALILVSIPADSGFAFMIYDGRRQDLAAKTVYKLYYLPEHGTWMRIDGREVMMP